MVTPAAVNVTVDPYEALEAAVNTDHALTIDDLEVEKNKPETEDSTVEEPVAKEPAPEVPNEWQIKAEESAAKLLELERNLESYKPYFEQIEKSQRDQLEKAVDTIVGTLDKVSEASSEPLSDTDRNSVRVAIKSAIEYEQLKPELNKTLLYIDAMRQAYAVVGPDAKVSEFIEMGNELLQYGSKDGMAAYAAVHKKLTAQNKTVTQETNKTARIASKIDQPPTTPVQSGGVLRTINDFEKQISKPGGLTDKQWDQYMQLRKLNGMD